MVSSSNLRWALTSSTGVRASHYKMFPLRLVVWFRVAFENRIWRAFAILWSWVAHNRQFPYGQVCAQIFPHPRAFDGMLARAPGSLPMLDSDLYMSLQHLNETLDRIYTIYTYTIAIKSPKSELKMSSLQYLKSRDIAAQRTIISLARKRGLDARVIAN